MALTILVVDDSAFDRLIIQNMLSEFHVLLASDGVEALDQIRHHDEIDLMILDLNMPNMDGFQVLDALNADVRDHKLRTIILTNYDELENEIRGLQLGAVDYIRKPIHMASLKARIDTHAELIRIQNSYRQMIGDQIHTFETVFNQAPIGIAISYNDKPVHDGDDVEIRINPAFESITGRTKEELIRLGWLAITHPDDLAEDQAYYQRFIAGEIDGYSMDKRFIRPDGSSVWVYMVVAPLNLKNQNRYRHICLIQDISPRKQMEHALAESERSKSVLLSHLPGLAYRCRYDREWTMLFVSDGCLELTGYPAKSIIGNKERSFNDLIAPEYRQLVWENWNQDLDRRQPFRYEYEIITASNERKWVMEMGQGIYGAQGNVEALEGIILDISDRKKMEGHLKFNSEHDTWTGLFNRRYLEALLKKDSSHSIREKRALVGINLSSLHSLYRIYGFHYVWDLLKKISDALTPYCSEDRLLFSMYENQFAFYVKAYQNREAIREFCRLLSGTLRDLLTIERVNAGIGIVEINMLNVRNVDHLFKSMLIASEKAIENNEDFSCSFFDQEMEAEIMKEDEIKRELALIATDQADDQLIVQFQPILDLRSGRICSFESLARFRSLQFGLVSPLEFIPIAEETKYIIPLGYKIISMAFQFLNTLKNHGFDDLSVSINISAIQLLQNDFSERLYQLIREHMIDPSNVDLEITESILAINYQEINTILGDLQSQGIKVALDDFGTGYSSLSRERELNINYLKIDKSFIDKLAFLKPEESITGDIISMAHKLGHCVVAEGVEHERQRRYLENHDCDRIQGYLISKPLDPDAAIALLKNQTVESASDHKSDNT